MDRITFAAVGDVMLGSDWPAPKLPTANPLLPAAPRLRAADLAFANLEGPLCDGGAVHPAKANAANSYAFRMPTRYGAWLREAGIDLVSVANNHANDFQENGRRQTLQALTRCRIAAVGAAGGATARKTVRGTDVRFVGFATNGVNPNLNDTARAQALVQASKAKGGLVVVSFHGGAEGSSARHVPRGMERFHGERRGDLRRFAHAVVDAGADLVLGHGPHVLRGMELYRGRLIAYSLGNFATFGRMSLVGPCGRTVVLEASLAPDGRFVAGHAHPYLQQNGGVPQPDPRGAALADLRELSAADFGRAAPRIAADGAIVFVRPPR